MRKDTLFKSIIWKNYANGRGVNAFSYLLFLEFSDYISAFTYEKFLGSTTGSDVPSAFGLVFRSFASQLTWTLSSPATSALLPLMVTVHWLRHLPFQKFFGLYWWSSMQTTILLPAYKKDAVNNRWNFPCHLFGENSWDPMIVVVFDIAGNVSLNGWPQTFYPGTLSGPWLKIGSLLAKVIVFERLLGPWDHND